jgi:predicted small secreted protein
MNSKPNHAGDRSGSGDRPVLAKRAGIAALVLVVASVLTGCAALPGVGPGCGPGGTDIGAIDGNASDVEFKGTLVEINESAMVLDDGTGQARLLLTSDLTGEASSGDCIVARGAAQSESDGGPDVVMLPTEILKEKYVAE